METIAKIVTKTKIMPTIEFVDVTDSMASNINMPTLIIGKSLAIELCGRDKIKMLNRDITKQMSWTFSRRESRIDHEKDIEKFRNRLLSEILSKIDYKFYNLYTNSLNNTKALIRFVFYSNMKKYIFLCNDNLYIYFTNNAISRVVSISLNDCEFLGIKKEKIVQKIINNRNNILFTDRNINFPRIYKLIKNNYDYLVPYFYSLNN